MQSMYVYARDCLDAKHAPPQKNSNLAGSVTPPPFTCEFIRNV